MTAETRPGEANRGPGVDDDRERPECGAGELEIAGRTHTGKATAPLGGPAPSAVALPLVTTSAPTRQRPRVLAFIALTKPRIIELLLITTVPTMVVAEGGVPSIWLMVATVIGGTLAAGGANAFNMYIDRDIDRLMERTKT